MSDTQDEFSETLPKLLRAVADEMDGDPALAARIAQRLQPELAPLMAIGSSEKTNQLLHNAIDGTIQETPTAGLRHGRRSSRYGAPTVPGASAPAGAIDPFKILQERGAEALQNALDTLRAGALRALIRKFEMDPSAKLSARANEARLREWIVSAAQTKTVAKPTKTRKKTTSG